MGEIDFDKLWEDLLAEEFTEDQIVKIQEIIDQNHSW